MNFGIQTVFCSPSVLPRDGLLACEVADCAEVRMWESQGFSECANSNVLVASDGTGCSRDTPKSHRKVALEWPPLPWTC